MRALITAQLMARIGPRTGSLPIEAILARTIRVCARALLRAPTNPRHPRLCLHARRIARRDPVRGCFVITPLGNDPQGPFSGMRRPTIEHTSH